MGSSTIALLRAVQPAPAPGRWIVVSQNAEQTNYVDSQTIRIAGDRRIFWHRVIYMNPVGIDTASEMYNVDVDCSRRTQALLGGSEYNRPSRVIQSHNFPSPEYIPVMPDTEGEILHLCLPI